MISKEKVIQEISRHKSIPFMSLAKRLGIPRNENREFSSLLFSLVKSSEIFTNREREYYCPNFIGEDTGILKLHPKGFGFIDLTDEISIFIPGNYTNSAMDGDEVQFKYEEQDRPEKSYQGVITKVLKRSRDTFVARVEKFGDRIGLIPLDQKIKGRFRFTKDYKGETGDVVKVKIVKFGNYSQVEFIKKLGRQDDVSMDIISLIEDAGVKSDFGHATIQEAKNVPDTVQPDEIKGRKDFRNNLVVTIDGDDTKDFDDAIEVRKLDNGNYILAVHIADVTHYVKEKNALDNEAKARGTSIYLADRVIPMLPKTLSNGICSLNPHVDRLTISVEIEIDKNGNNVNYEIFEGVINSKHRLTYKEVNNFYEGTQKFDDDLTAMLTEAHELSKIIRSYKEEEGYIDFEIEEAKLVIDEKGNTSDIVVRDRSYSEMMIEDFMVRANETIAHIAFEKELPFIYRVHAKPELERLTALQNVLNVLGIKIKVPTSPEPKKYADMVKEIKSERFDDFMKILMLRTMSKAIYSPVNIGHFGLASQDYTHFTSPIRRYPDLMVHRMLREYFFKGNLNLASHFNEILPAISASSSEAEQKAVGLERKVADIKKAEFYEKFIGQKFDGQIVSVMKFGFFVEFPNKVNGLVHVSNLMGGEYNLDKTALMLQSKDKTITIGDKVQVVVIGTTKSEGKIDLVLAEEYDQYKKVNNIK